MNVCENDPIMVNKKRKVKEMTMSKIILLYRKY